MYNIDTELARRIVRELLEAGMAPEKIPAASVIIYEAIVNGRK